LRPTSTGGKKSTKEVFTVQGIEGTDGKAYNDFGSAFASLLSIRMETLSGCHYYSVQDDLRNPSEAAEGQRPSMGLFE
jgi:hypothetical protein